MNKFHAIRTLKNKALTLYQRDQIPFGLFKRIDALNGKESTPYVETLKELAEKFIRVYGYYKKYPLDKKIANEIIEKTIRERFGDVVPIWEERSNK